MDEGDLLEKWKTSPDVEEIMLQIRRGIEERRAGGSYSRNELRSETAIWLSEVMSSRASGESILHHHLDTVGQWRMQLHPNFSSHRGWIGRVLVSIKKHILYPPLRWVVEFIEVNAWRQDRLNVSLLNLLEEMALEIGLLRARLDRLEQAKAESKADLPASPDKTAP
jgi:hypothetical protein